MPKLALYVPLKAKPGKERNVADFLTSALPLVQADPAGHYGGAAAGQQQAAGDGVGERVVRECEATTRHAITPCDRDDACIPFLGFRFCSAALPMRFGGVAST